MVSINLKKRLIKYEKWVILILITWLFFSPYIMKNYQLTQSNEYNLELAQDWAPIFYQQIKEDTSSSNITYQSDFITTVNYDGDWNSRNNWDNLEKFKDQLKPEVYFWTVENDNCIVIGYMVYHPRDWSDQPFDVEHENDVEGVILALKKTNNGNILRLTSTLAHDKLLQYVPPNFPSQRLSRLIANEISLNDNFDNRITFYIEAMGHGIYGMQDQLKDPSNKNFIIYKLGEKSVLPNLEIKEATYTLRPISEIWEQRDNPNLFTSSGFIQSDRSGDCGEEVFDTILCTTKAAVPPWRWPQNQEYPGQIWYEPFKFHEQKVSLLSK